MRFRRARDERGQSMTEFAVVLPVLVLVLFAILQLGIAFNNYLTLTDAVRAGGRTAAVSRRASNPTNVAVTRVRAAGSNLNQSSLNVTVTSTWQPGADVTVRATYPYRVSLFGLVVKSGSLVSQVVERVE